jgi:glycosyltransferase involved in cell wall biosynthesis
VALVRIVIPTYNRSSEVMGAIDTAERQTFSDWELGVVDDGSSDDTVERLKPLLLRDARIRLIEANHGGAAAARNIGITAPGDYKYIAFLDADDRWQPRHLEQSVALLESEPEMSLVSGVFATQDLTGTWTADEFARREAKIRRMPALAARQVTPDAYVLDARRSFSAFLRSAIFPYTSTVVVRASIAGPGPWFDPTLIVMEDSAFYLRLGATGHPWGFLDTLQCTVRFLGDNLTRSTDLSSPATLVKQRAVLEFCRRRLAVCRDAGDRAHVRRETAAQAYLVGQCCTAQGDRRGARAAYVESLRNAVSAAAMKSYLATFLPQAAVSSLKSILRQS